MSRPAELERERQQRQPIPTPEEIRAANFKDPSVEAVRKKWIHEVELALEIDEVKHARSIAPTIKEQIRTQRAKDHLRSHLIKVGYRPEQVAEMFAPRKKMVDRFMRTVSERARAFVNHSQYKRDERNQSILRWRMAATNAHKKDGSALTALEVEAFVLTMIDIHSPERT